METQAVFQAETRAEIFAIELRPCCRASSSSCRARCDAATSSLGGGGRGGGDGLRAF